MQDEHSPLISPNVILLIEDDLHDVELFRLALAQSGSHCHVAAVQFARDAIKYLMRFGEYADEKQFPKPALIVLDLSLPGMTGMEFLSWALAEPPENIPPIVVLSYSALEFDRQLAQKFGAKAYFVKSPDLKETAAMIKRMLLTNLPPPPCTEQNQKPSKGFLTADTPHQLRRDR